MPPIVLPFVLILCACCLVNGIITVFPYKYWSQQATFQLPNSSSTYGRSQAIINGRGFRTLITGFDLQDPSVFVHTTDDGKDGYGYSSWSLQAKLRPSPRVSSSALFGAWVQGYNQTAIVSAPRSNEFFAQQGSVYIYNGTRRHWTQLQKLVMDEGGPNMNFGSSIALDGNRLLVGAPGDNNMLGAAYLFERPYEGARWSRTEKLFPRDAVSYSSIPATFTSPAVVVLGSLFAQTVALYNDTAAMKARNVDTDPPGNRTSTYIFQMGTVWLLNNIYMCVHIY